MNPYQGFEASDEILCGPAFTEDGAPNLLIAAAWAINGHRSPANRLTEAAWAEDTEDDTDDVE